MAVVRPVDLPEMRDRLVEFAGTDIAASMRGLDISEGRLPKIPVAKAVEEWRNGLRRAELFHVTAEMGELIDAAAQSLPEFTLAPEDVPTPHGLAWFAVPIEDSDLDSATFVVVGVGWTTVLDAVLWITTFVDRESCPSHVIDKVREWFPTAIPMGVFQTSTAEPIPGLLRNDDPNGRRTLASAKALWLLMGQPLAQVEDASLDRATRRRLQRRGKEPASVRVIHLRRPPGAASDTDGVRDWHHQWIVRGHWRMQPWGPQRARRRPVWISPYVKGPEGKPLLGGQKVYAVAGGA